MGRELFGTDGVRAVAGEYPLDDAGARAIGRAIGTQFAEADQQIVIACDTRESSEHLVELVSAGMREVGVNVVFVGIMPTPGLAYITAQHAEFVAGVMITASHNPYTDNGVKVFAADGGKLPDSAEERLNVDIEVGVPDRSSGGTFERHDLISEYEAHLVEAADTLDLHGVRIAVDSAHGAASGISKRVFEHLGAEVVAMGDAPNGRNINVACGATNTAALRELVVARSCQFGIAVDGDADRLIMVDEKGRECNGDHLLYLLALANGYDAVVATVMTNLGAERSLQQQGVKLERTAVGDRYVLERLQATGYQLGGEQSGHIILTEFATTGDGLLAAVCTAKAIQESGKSLCTWRDEVTVLPQALVNFSIDDKSKLQSPEAQQYIEDQTATLGSAGRILVRPSGTEPLARVMVEAEGAQDLAASMAARLQELTR